MRTDLDLVENRDDCRYRVALPLTFSVFSSTLRSFIDATVSDCSTGGMCIRSSVPLNEGQYIYIRSGTMDPECVSVKYVPASPRCHSLATVRWCLSEPSGAAAGYRIGIEYL